MKIKLVKTRENQIEFHVCTEHDLLVTRVLATIQDSGIITINADGPWSVKCNTPGVTVLENHDHIKSRSLGEPAIKEPLEPDQVLARIEAAQNRVYVPVKVGRGNAVHAAQVITYPDNPDRPSVYVFCGANRCTTGSRWPSRISTMKGYKVTCKRCIKNMAGYPGAQEALEVEK